MAARARVRRQIRGFVLIWSLLTVLVGVLTFAAIYVAYGTINTRSMNSAAIRNVALASGQNPTSVARQVIVSTSTPFPTRQPLSAVTPTDEEASGDATEEGGSGLAEATEEAPAAPTATPTQLPVDVDRFELGTQVQVSYDLMGVWLDEAHLKMSVNWVKMQVRWEDIEPEQGQYEWRDLDVFLPAASERGIKVLISVVTAPAWARESGINTERHGPPADPATYAGFVRAILERYPDQVHAIEVWNEMNLDREWTSTRGISAANYVALLRTTYETVKQIDPGIIVVSGALSPTGFDDGVTARDDATFMGELIRAGMLNYTDCVGAHHNGYNISPEYTHLNVPNDPSAQFRGPFDNRHRSWSFRSTLENYANQIASAGGDQKLCVTEFGWPTAAGIGGFPRGFEFAADNTPEEQRDFLVAAAQMMADGDTVRLAFVWNLNYGPQAGFSADNDNVPYSLIGPEGHRPAFDAIGEWQREYEAQSN